MYELTNLIVSDYGHLNQESFDMQKIIYILAIISVIYTIPFAVAQINADATAKKVEGKEIRKEAKKNLKKEAKVRKVAKSQCKKFAKDEQVSKEEMTNYMTDCVNSLTRSTFREEE